MNIISRLFCYPMLEQKVAERDATIAEQKERIVDLEARLFMRYGMPPRMPDTPSSGKAIEPYRTGRRRVKDMLTPPVVVLSEEDEKAIEGSLTQ